MTSRSTCISVFAAALALGLANHYVAAEEGKPDPALLEAIPKSKHTLADGIREAEKAHGKAISAKFEFDDHGKLSLSVYTAEKGLGPDAEHNVLEELSGSPEAEKWTPEVEVFKDVPHVSRASQQLTLMSVASVSLADVIAKAEKKQPGRVFSVTPAVEDKRPVCRVLVAVDDAKAVELAYDLVTGELHEPKKK